MLAFAVVEVLDDAVEIVGKHRAARAPLRPIRREHEVVNDELGPVFEQIGETYGARRILERVILFRSSSRGAPRRRAASWSLSRVSAFSSRKQCPAGSQPIALANHLVFHAGCPPRGCDRWRHLSIRPRRNRRPPRFATIWADSHVEVLP